MKSPKNIVKAFMLTSLIVSSISAFDAGDFPGVIVGASADAAVPAVLEGATKVAAPVAKGFFARGLESAQNTVATYPKTAKGLAATGVAATLGGLGYYGYQNSWASRAWNKAASAATSVKDFVVNYKKTCIGVTATAAATGVAAYLFPEQRNAVKDAVVKGFNYVKDAAKAHPYIAGGTVATPFVCLGARAAYNKYNSPAADVSDNGQPNDDTTTQGPAENPAPAVRTVVVNTTPAPATALLPQQGGFQRSSVAINLLTGKPYTDAEKALSAKASAVRRNRLRTAGRA